MTNEERWDAFISELRAYIEEHNLCPPKQTSLRNQVVYFRRKMRDGLLPEDKAEELDGILSMRDLTIHTGGHKKKIPMKNSSM